MTRAGLLAVVLLCACRSLPPLPPSDPLPAPPSTGTPCERSCERRGQLGCEPAIGRCVEACDAYERQGPAYSWQPECQASATTCAAWDRCATGAR